MKKQRSLQKKRNAGVLMLECIIRIKNLHLKESSEEDTTPLSLRYEALRLARKNDQRRAKLEEARRLRHEKRRKRINRKNEQRKREKRLAQLQAFGWKEVDRPSSSSSNGHVRLHWRNQLFVHRVYGEATSIKRIL